MANQELIAGLEDAVAAAPGNVALRLHLVEHMTASGRPVEALAHCEAILRAQPDNTRAAELAARSAEVAGDLRAAPFARLAHALRSTFAPVDAHAVHPAGIRPVLDYPAASASHAPEPVVEPTSGMPGISDAPSAELPAHVDEAQPADSDDEPDEVEEVEEVAPEPPREFTIDPESIQRPTISLRNIIGVNDVKQRIKSVVLDPLRRPARAGNGNGGHSAPRQGGFLMFGPPGCGKGFFGRVVAGELGAAYLPIKLGKAADWPGDPRQNIQRIFEAARDAAPCVLFLDEVDRAGRHPDAPEDSVDRGVVNRLVTELDTANANSGVHVFAGAVAPWDIDMALRSDGRLDRTLLVLPPDEAAREAILRFHLKNTRFAGVDVGWIVQRTQHFSGDDLLLLCETAAALAETESPGGQTAIGPGHVTRALREVRPTAPAWFSAVMDRSISSNHGGIYDEALAYIDEHQLV
jgi:SpoVK/Ycf46/Vps4 family AAA+-type ATPase